MTGFEGWGDFDSDDPWQRFIAHEAAKGNLPHQATNRDSKKSVTARNFCEKMGTSLEEMADVQEQIERGEIEGPPGA